VAEIRAAVESDVDLVLSLDAGNLEQAAPHINNSPVVILPTNMRNGVTPRTAEERVILLEKNISKAKRLGIEKIIADPVLEPAIKPGLMESLKAYQLFRRRNADTPVLFGLGNVTELMDIDSTGVNGLLAALACEVEAELLFIPEHSVKARGSVRETADASKMMFLARRNETPPKDLGVDLLILKEKRWTEEEYDRSTEVETIVVDAEGETHFAPDKRGWFKIQIDRERSMIVVSHYRAKSNKPDAIIRGRNAEEIYQTIIRETLIGNLEHASYMGRELGKAELALLLGRSYSQDEPLFQ
jgi:dihydropteroate synthase-like protein